MHSITPGVYLLYDGREWWGQSAFINIMSAKGEQRQNMGIGSLLELENERWIATGIHKGECLILKRAALVDLDSLELPPENLPIYPNAEMSNLWIQKEQPTATWVADLTVPVQNDPQCLIQFMEEVIAAGEETEIMRIMSIDSIGYARWTSEIAGNALETPFIDFLRKQWSTQNSPDLIGSMWGVTIHSKMAWFDQSSRVTEGYIGHLETILEGDEPYPGATDGFREPWPNITLWGADSKRVQEAHSGTCDLPIQLRFQLHSDIWFPWIYGVCHPSSNHGHKFDNRLLAERHTPRLNAFFKKVAKASEAVGGTFGLDIDECFVSPDTINDQGIILDGAPPKLIFAEEVRNEPWD
jgi:hypothetical protein